MSLQTGASKYTIAAAVLAAMLLAAFAALFFTKGGTGGQYYFSSAQVGERQIELELANTREQQVKGLSGRGSLAEESGLLFVYDQPLKVGIWMKDMNFEIDVFWLDTEGEIVHLVENMSPDSYRSSADYESYRNDEPAKYVLEVNAGIAEEENLEVGDKIVLN